MAKFPKKIKNEPLVQVIFQMKFDSPVSSEFPESVVTDLSRLEDDWKSFKRVHSNAPDFPKELLAINPEFRFQPKLNLQRGDGKQQISIGPNIFGMDLSGDYPGWEVFESMLSSPCSKMFESFEGLKCLRLGLRYVNSFNSSHDVSSLYDLNCNATINGSSIDEPINITYKSRKSDDCETQVRIASKEYVTGLNDSEVSALVDIDVYSPPSWQCDNFEAVAKWLSLAHEIKNEEFFKLLTPEMVTNLTVSE